MKVLFHPEFGPDIQRIEQQYKIVSPGLAKRFRTDVEAAIRAVTASPGSAGHFLHCNSRIIEQLRRRNLRSFPFFILYGFREDELVFGSLIPNRSDPLTWLSRFRTEANS